MWLVATILDSKGKVVVPKLTESGKLVSGTQVSMLFYKKLARELWYTAIFGNFSRKSSGLIIEKSNPTYSWSFTI